MLSFFNDYNYCLLLGMSVFLVICFFYLIKSQMIFKSFKLNYSMLEFFCAFIPIFFVMLQMMPSLGLLFLFNIMNMDSHLSIKVTGHQWYWEYILLDFDLMNQNKSHFDSYLLNMMDLKISDDMHLKNMKEFKTLVNFERGVSTDNIMILPVKTMVRFLVTSADVVHSFSLQDFSLKLDAMSGLLNVQNIFLFEIGNFKGFCSEICGVGHSNMPICMQIMPMINFMNYF